MKKYLISRASCRGSRSPSGSLRSPPSVPLPLAMFYFLLAGLVMSTPLQASEFDLQQGLRAETETWMFHLGARLALDGRYYDSTNVRDSEIDFEIRDLRLDGQSEDALSFRIVADLKGVETDYGLREAWLSMDLGDQFRLTGGVIPISIGIESSFERADYSFSGFGFPSYLDSRTDLGLKLEGELKDGLFSAVLDLAAGEGFDQNGKKRSDPQISTRLVSYPLLGMKYVGGVFGSLGASYTPDYDGYLDVATPLRNNVFKVGRLDGSSSQFFSWGGGVDAGLVRFTLERVQGSIDDLKVPGGGKESLEDQIISWETTLTWRINGEPYDSRPFRQRRSAFPSTDNGDGASHESEVERCRWGQFEIILRYANADIDRDFFDLGFTDEMTSSQEFRTFTGGVNWEWSKNLRVSVEVFRTIADQRPAVFETGEDSSRDTSGVLRLQYQF